MGPAQDAQGKVRRSFTWHGACRLALALLLGCTLLLVSLPTPALARTIRVGYYEFAGYQEQAADGTRSGYGYEFLQEMARYAGWDYEYVGYDLGWADLQKMLDDGEIDILTSARKTPEREQTYLFSTEIGTSAGILTVKSGDTRATAGDYATYQNLRVGMIKDSSINQNFASFAQAKGFSYQPVYYTNVEELDAALQAGSDIDAVCTTNLRKPQNEWLLDEFDQSNFYVMMNGKDSELQSEVNAAIAQMDLYSPGWRTTLWNKFYTPDSGDQVSLSTAERDYLADVASTRTYSVLLNPDDAPYSYFEGGQAKGIVPTIFTEVARRAGISFTFVETSDRTSYAQAIADHTADIVADSLFDYNKAEAGGYRLTNPYLDVPISQVTHKGAGSETTTVAELSRGDATYGGQVKISDDAKVVTFDTVEECLDAVDTGRADVAYAFPYTIQRFLDEGKGSGFTVVMLPDASVSYAVSVSTAEDPRLLTILDKAVVGVKENYVENAVVAEVSTSTSHLDIRAFLRQNPIWFVVPVLLVAGFASLGAILANRQRTLKLIQEKNVELNDAVLKTNEANEAKSNFLSSMSHDMRTPLNGIIGFTNFALEETDEQKRIDDLKKIRQSSKILLGLVNDTLELSRIESGKFVLEPEWFDGGELCSDIGVVIGASARAKGITFVAPTDCPDGLFLYADRLKLQELLLNLLSNAVKYTDPGGTVRFSVSLPAPGTSEGCTIVVADTGIGISEEFLPRIYESFAQEGDARTHSEGGAGLGLAIVKRIVDLMGGEISVESEKGKGTTFTVRFPLMTRYGRPATTDEGVRSPADDGRRLDGTKVLLAEDNQLNSEIAERLLEGRGIEVVCTANGRAAVEAFAHTKPGEIQAILMDVHMPKMDGFEATRAIRKLDRPDAASVPIIAMTADAYAEDVRKCLDAGMDDHVAKPIDPARLFAALENALARKGQDPTR